MKSIITVTIVLLGLAFFTSIFTNGVKIRYAVSAEHQIEKVK